MNRPGFTLIEVLVALAIFALAAVALGAAYANVIAGYRQANDAETREQEMRLVRREITTAPDRAKAAAGGTLELPGKRQARWTASIGEGNVADLFQVNLHCSVTGPDTRVPWTTEEIFMLLRPGWSDPAGRDRLRRQPPGTGTRGRLP